MSVEAVRTAPAAHSLAITADGVTGHGHSCACGVMHATAIVQKSEYFSMGFCPANAWLSCGMRAPTPIHREPVACLCVHERYQADAANSTMPIPVDRRLNRVLDS